MEEKKVSQQINDIVGDNVKKLAALFPSVVKDGEVDFDALREELGQFKEVSSEKYELTWAGKKNAKKLAQEDVVARTLNIKAEECINVSETQNIYIEGDNLEVLKLIRQNYYGAVKVIFIDPPYNTGGDFVYKDSFYTEKNESDIAEGMKNEDGERYSVNSKSQNRFHATWLTNMYARLKVARDLLTDDGAIFISIDFNECYNLKKLCDEIFGEDCFVCGIAWRSSDNSNNDAKQFSNDHNEILVYSKMAGWRPKKQTDESKQGHFKNPDNDPKGPWFDGNPLNSPNYRENLRYAIEAPNGNIIQPPKNGWRWSKETLEEKMKSGEIYFNENQTNIKRRTYLCDMEGLPPSSLWIDFDKTGHNRQAKYELLDLMPEDVFDTPKPTKLIKYIIQLVDGNEDAIVMDFFSGSGTTAEAVMQLNVADGGTRRFVLVQLKEDLDKSLEKAPNDKKTVLKNAIRLCDSLGKPHYLSEIAKERIKRAGDRIRKENPEYKGDLGFKVFETADTNIKWNTLISEGQLNLTQIKSTPDLLDFMPGANDIDVVYEIMLRQRDVPLSEQVEQLNDIGERTYLYACAYLICLETEISTEMIDKLADIDPVPMKYVFRDSAFKDDISLKDETFRRLKAVIEKNTNQTKQTYTVEYVLSESFYTRISR